MVWNSVHYNNKCRFDKATSQKNLMDEYVSREETSFDLKK